MSDQYFFILNISIISLFQIYLIISYFRKNIKGKAFENLLIYAVVLPFLLYEHFSELNIMSFILTCSVLTVIGHSFVGTYLNFYFKSTTYDRYLHLFGAFSFALLAFSILNHIIPFMNEIWVYTFLLVTTLGITIGVLFEIAEFIHDSFSKKMKCQHGLADTDFDLIFNVFGSAIAGLLSIFIFL